MKKQLVAALAATTLSVGVFAPTVVSAQESDSERKTPIEREIPADFEEAKDRCIRALEHRFTRLSDAARARVTESDVVTDGHEADLLAIVDRTTSSLEQLEPQIVAATNPAELHPPCASMVVDHRVFLLVLPQVRLVVGHDHVQAGATKATSAAGELSDAIARAEEAGYDVGEAHGLLGEMEASIAAATSTVSGLPEAVLPLTPADWNDGTAKPVLDDARSDLRSAHDDLQAATANARAIVKILRTLNDANVDI